MNFYFNDRAGIDITIILNHISILLLHGFPDE